MFSSTLLVDQNVGPGSRGRGFHSSFHQCCRGFHSLLSCLCAQPPRWWWTHWPHCPVGWAVATQEDRCRLLRTWTVRMQTPMRPPFLSHNQSWATDTHQHPEWCWCGICYQWKEDKRHPWTAAQSAMDPNAKAAQHSLLLCFGVSRYSHCYLW